MSVSRSIIRSESISTDRLTGLYDDDLIICPICTNVLWKPIACKTCENSFYLKCLRLWLKEKPKQCPFNCVFEERKAPGILLKLLSKLKLECQNKSNGCLLTIHYESLEKHQLQECLFRYVQCSSCSEEILFKDLQIHQKESCSLIELTCLKCSTNYYQKDGHTSIQCLKIQSEILQKAIEKKPTSSQTLLKSLNKLEQLYLKQLNNQLYANRRQSNYTTEQYLVSPSAPFEDTDPSLPSQSESTTERDTQSTPKAAGESLRMSTVNFCHISGSRKEGGHVPNGYAAFNWENAHYMYKEYALTNYQLKGFLNGFNNLINCIAFNGNGNSLSIYLINPQNKFTFHSFESFLIYHSPFQLSITGYRSNQPIYIKHITLTHKSPILFEMDFQEIEKITFKPSFTPESLKPPTFALINLNFIF